MTEKWKKILTDAKEIRQRFIDNLSKSHEPEAVISACLSVIYETTMLYEDEDFTTEYSAYSSLGLFLIDHADEKIDIHDIHGVTVFVAECGETIELSEDAVQDAQEVINYIR